MVTTLTIFTTGTCIHPVQMAHAPNTCYRWIKPIRIAAQAVAADTTPVMCMARIVDTKQFLMAITSTIWSTVICTIRTTDIATITDL